MEKYTKRTQLYNGYLNQETDLLGIPEALVVPPSCHYLSPISTILNCNTINKFVYFENRHTHTEYIYILVSGFFRSTYFCEGDSLC